MIQVITVIPRITAIGDRSRAIDPVRSGGISRRTGPNTGFQNTAVRRLVLNYSNINYGVWDHLVFDTTSINPVPVPGAVILTSIGILSVGWLHRRKTL